MEIDNLLNIVEINGKRFINATPHPLRLDNGITIKGNQELAQKLTATPVEKVVKSIGKIKLVTTVFKPTKEGLETYRKLKDDGFIVIGSIITAQAYKGIVSPITTPETTRKPPAEKIVISNKWNVYY